MNVWAQLVSRPERMVHLPKFSCYASLGWVDHYDFWSSYWRSIQQLRLDDIRHPVLGLQPTSHWRHTDSMVMEGLRVGNTSMLVSMPRDNLETLLRERCGSSTELIHPAVYPRLLQKMDRDPDDTRMNILWWHQRQALQRLPWTYRSTSPLSQGLREPEALSMVATLAATHLPGAIYRQDRLRLLGHAMLHAPRDSSWATWISGLQSIADAWGDGWNVPMMALCSGIGTPTNVMDASIHRWGREMHTFLNQRAYGLDPAQTLQLSPATDATLAMLAHMEPIQTVEMLYLSLEKAGVIEHPTRGQMASKKRVQPLPIPEGIVGH